MATFLEQAGQRDKALEVLAKRIDHQPTNRLHHTMADLLVKSGEPEKALEHYTTALMFVFLFFVFLFYVFIFYLKKKNLLSPFSVDFPYAFVVFLSHPVAEYDPLNLNSAIKWKRIRRYWIIETQLALKPNETQ